MDAKSFIEAVGELSEARGLSKEDIVIALQEAMFKAYLKFVGGKETKHFEDKEDEPGDEPYIKVEIDGEKGTISLFRFKDVREEDDITDDFREISVEEANANLPKKAKKYVAGDQYVEEASIDDITKVAALAVKNFFRQRLAEAERTRLYQTYKDHIGEMVTGTVERSDAKGITISLGRTNIDLSKKELIGDEEFRTGDLVKVYIQEVKSASEAMGKAKGPQIQATRSSEGFIKRLFEEEIHEIIDGTVVIKGIVRMAGFRTKVAVSSINEDVDPTGACIGKGGDRIQKIVGQLGNGKNKEKIDVINYSTNIPYYVIEASRPANVIGVKLSEDGKSAIAVIPEDESKFAYGKRQSNIILASKLTGVEITFMEKPVADKEGIEYVPADVIKAEVAEQNKILAREAYRAKTVEEAAAKAAKQVALRAAAEEERRRQEAAIAAAKRKEEEASAKPTSKPAPKVDPLPATPIVAPKATAKAEDFPTEAFNPAAAALAAMQAAKNAPAEPAVESNEEEAAVVTEVPANFDVKTTTTLSELEKSLESNPAAKAKSTFGSKRPRKITEEEVKRDTPKPSITVPVYTEEELAAIEEEEANLDINDDYDEEDIENEDAEYAGYYDEDDNR